MKKKRGIALARSKLDAAAGNKRVFEAETSHSEEAAAPLRWIEILEDSSANAREEMGMGCWFSMPRDL